MTTSANLSPKLSMLRTCGHSIYRSVSLTDTKSCENDTVSNYELGAVYTPSAEGGLQHDNPRLGARMAPAADRHLPKGSKLSIPWGDRRQA
jgi:hypothetical protein